MAKIIKVPKGYKAHIYIRNNRPDGKKFFFNGPSLTIVNDSEDFGQDLIKIIFEKTSYRKKERKH